MASFMDDGKRYWKKYRHDELGWSCGYLRMDGIQNGWTVRSKREFSGEKSHGFEEFFFQTASGCQH